jgi:hypothetical protein
MKTKQKIFVDIEGKSLKKKVLIYQFNSENNTELSL